jgi:HK97 family phage prohead protease
MQNRAYSVLEVKSIDDARRVFRGIATTPTPDRVGDIIDPKGMKFKNPLPLLWQHKHDAPIGQVTFGQPTAKGTPFEAEIPIVEEECSLKDRVDTAWGEIKHGLVRATSIGFLPLAAPERNKAGGLTYGETEIYELSAVTIPMNAEAIITQIKSIDAAYREAEGIVEDPEIPAEPVKQDATVKTLPVVKLAPARDRAPFVIKKIHPAKPAGRQQ